MAKVNPIDVGALMELLAYDPETGTLTWRVARRAGKGKGRVTADVGSVAGTTDKDGYRVITICRRHIFAHRAAWAIVSGSWPLAHIDHVNGIPGDNRLCNLREATARQNAANKETSKRNVSGLKGALRHAKSGLWRAECRVDGKIKSLGYFKTPEEAHLAYMKAARELYGEFACDGRR